MAFQTSLLYSQRELVFVHCVSKLSSLTRNSIFSIKVYFWLDKIKKMGIIYFATTYDWANLRSIESFEIKLVEENV